MKKYKLALPELDNSQLITYNNALQAKLRNKRVTVLKEEKDNGWVLEFRRLSERPLPNPVEWKRGINTTTIFLTKESAETVMLLLADQMGLKVIERD